jgi:hypothetical protein
MKITFSPQRRDDSVTYHKAGDIVMVDGEAFDFSQVEEGDVLPRDAIQSEWFSSDVTRSNGDLEIGLILPNPWNYSQEQAFPEPLTITKNGIIELPKPLPIVQEEQVSE